MIHTAISKADLMDRIRQHQQWRRAFGENPNATTDTRLIVSRAIWPTIEVSGVDLADAEILECELRNVAFRECSFVAANFMGTHSQLSRFVRCSFVKADLRGSSFDGCDLTGSDFSRADLTDASFVHATLNECSFQGAWLVNTDLRRAMLNSSEFRGTRIAEAKFLAEQSFQLGSFEGAVVKGAVIGSEADIRRVDGVALFDYLTGSQ